MIKRIVGAIKRRLRPAAKGPDVVFFEDSPIPAPDRRWCGPEFKEDAYYVASAVQEAERLVRLGCTSASSVLDIGCGQGRLAIGLQRVLKTVNYLGLDLHGPSIHWCQKHFQSRYPSFRFQELDVQNERYNPNGKPLNDDWHLPLADASQDFVYLYSVFSHMTQIDIERYLREIMRVLRPSGCLFFTTYVEDNVPAFEVNPENYFIRDYSGPLHVVRFERQHLFAVLKAVGFDVVDFSHRTEADIQSAVTCRPGPI